MKKTGFKGELQHISDEHHEWVPFDEWLDELAVHIHRDPFGSTECGAMVAPRKVPL